MEIMRYLFLCLALAVVPQVGAAEGCPPAPDHTDRMAALIAEVRDADNEGEARAITNRMWELWADAPDEPSQEMLDRGMRKRDAYDYLGALQDLSALVAYCPHYAEGYNQRAFVNYLRQDFAAALIDLDRAITLSPTHIAAIAGRALTLMGLHRMDEARLDMARALELNPWLPERGLTAPGGPLAPRGQDI